MIELDDTLENTNVLITGGSSETGPFICEAFRSMGANLATTYFSNVESAEENADHAFHLDLTDAGSVDALVEDVKDTFDELDVLVLCAGSVGLRPFEDLSWDQLDTAIDGNVKGNFMLAKQLGFWMKRTTSVGKIILISAASSENTSHSAYGLGKAGQNEAAKFLSYNLAPEVTVNTIQPIGINQNADDEYPGDDPAPIGRKVHAREIARMCVLLTDPAFDTVTGELIRMDAGRHIDTAYANDDLR